VRAHSSVIGLVVALAACRDREPLPPASPRAPADAAATPRTKAVPAPACDGCEPVLLARLPANRGTAIALDGAGFAYIATFFDDAIYRVALEPGASPTLLYHSPGANLGNIEVHGDELRWSSNAAGRIYSAPTSGAGPVTVIAEALPGIWGFASDDSWIYWADFGGSAPGTIWKRQLRGGPSTAITRDPAATLVDHVLVAGDHVLFTAQSGRILRAPSGGGTAELFVEVEGTDQISGLAEDATHYYAATLSSGRVLRIDKMTRAVEIVATDAASPANVAVDARRVYWVDYTPVAVWCRAK
jgi:hypothetical protein